MESVVQLASDLLATKYYFVATSTLIFYDYFLTLSDEITYAWSGSSVSFVFILYLFNRYFSLCTPIIHLFAYFSPLWTFEMSANYTKCGRFVVFEWIQTILVVLPAEMILALRVYAMSGRKWYLLAFLTPIIVIQFSFAMFVISQKGNAALPTPDWSLDPFHVCILFPKLSIGNADIAILALSLAFDSIVFLLTLIITFTTLKRTRVRTPILTALQRDGAIYFFCIFSGNLLWLVFVLHIRPGLKFLQANPSMLITSIMINRLNLSLKKAAAKPHISVNWSLKVYEHVDFPSAIGTGSSGSPNGSYELHSSSKLSKFSKSLWA